MVLVPVNTTAEFLNENHYLGATKRGIAWRDEFGVVIFAKPTARRLPQDGTWLELSRWCLLGTKNGGSQQFAKVIEMIRVEYPAVTTLVSYSDPSVGHTGSLYKSCNWLWAPTWHRLRPPPTGNGTWGSGKVQTPKDRWVYLLSPDERRPELLRVKDESLVRKNPTIGYQEPRYRHGRFMSIPHNQTCGSSVNGNTPGSHSGDVGSTPTSRFTSPMPAPHPTSSEGELAESA
jgi:hypothetical protein